MAKEAFRFISAGASPSGLIQGLKTAVLQVQTWLDQQVVPLGLEETIRTVISTVGMNEPRFINLAVEAFTTVGKEGLVLVIPGTASEDSLEIIEDTADDHGYPTHFLPKGKQSRLTEPVAIDLTLKAIWRIGGVNDSEIKERLFQVKNIVTAIRAALKNGVVPGGSVTLLRASRILDATDLKEVNQALGMEVLRRALPMPLQAITAFSGKDSRAVIADILAHDDTWYGFDVHTGQNTNLIAAGVLEPVSLIQRALQNAFTLVRTLITTRPLVYAMENLQENELTGE